MTNNNKYKTKKNRRYKRKTYKRLRRKKRTKREKIIKGGNYCNMATLHEDISAFGRFNNNALSIGPTLKRISPP